LLIFFYSKASYSQNTYEIIDKGGIKYVNNKAPLWEKNVRINLELNKKIGDIDAEDKNFQFYEIYGIANDSKDNLYVLDRGNYRIQVFNKNGAYLSTIGRKGQGPGEFLMPTFIDCNNEDIISVFDLGNQRIQRFLPSGAYINIIKIVYNTTIFEHLSKNQLVVSSNLDSYKYFQKEKYLITIIDNNGNNVRNFGEPLEFDDQMTFVLGNAISGTIDNNDNLFITYLFNNRIEKYSSDGRLLFIANQPLNFNIPDKPKMWEFSKTKNGEIIYMPNFTYVSIGIANDNKGRIWIITFQKEKQLHPSNNQSSLSKIQRSLLGFSIFNQEGVFLCNIQIPDSVIANSMLTSTFQINKDKLYLIDTIKNMCVYEYNIIDK
jgi:hypothetical protein